MQEFKAEYNLSCFSGHCHTELSNLKLSDSTNKVKVLIQYAEKIGLRGIAITDHECLSSHIEAIKVTKEIHKTNPNFTLGLGNEIYLVNSLEEVKDNYTSGITKFPHFILIAKSKEGHLALRKMSTLAWMNSFRTGPMERTPLTTQQMVEVMSEHKGQVIASSACLGSLIGNKFKEFQGGSHTALKEIEDFINGCKYVFEDDFYLECQPSFQEDQIAYNNFIIGLGCKYNIKVIYTTDAHYLTKNHRQIHESFLNSKQGDREVSAFYSSTYVMTKEEVWGYFKDYISEQIFEVMTNNTLEIANKIEFYDLAQDPVVPPTQIPNFDDKHIMQNYTNEYEYIKKFYYSDYLVDKYLLFLTQEGMTNKNQEFDKVNMDRIEEELKQLWLISEKINQRLSSYYCLTKDLVDLMWKLSLVGIARGSVTGLYLAYLIDITQMNPITFNLPSWRHIHSSKPELADIDVDTEAAQRGNILKAIKEKYGYENTLNVATFKTLKPKLAILTAGRGLNYNYDEIQAMSDMIPIERGSQWSLNDCLFGNEEEERKPIRELINLLENYPQLRETALELEGLIVGRSIHASGIIIFPNGFIEQNSLMKAPNGDDITCWNLGDSEYTGGLKFDALTIESLDRMRTCMDVLVEEGKMEWKGSLRNTYNYYLHPDVIDYTDKEMWKLLYNGDVVNAFQYEGSVGKQALSKIHPQNFLELVTGNSLMRLANKGGEQPLDKYVRFKNNISLWYQEMREYGLNEEEINILEPHLLPLYGLADTQEVVMELTMDKGIVNFSLTHANKLRKGISKKSKKTIEDSKRLFFEEGLKNGTRRIFLDYVWDLQITPSLGYSFSKNHTNPYTGILVQEMNLAHVYGHMYWKCACLTVNSGAIGEGKTTNYGKIAKAVSEMNDIVDSPNINYSKEAFTIYENKILYGLRALSEVGSEDIETILNNRPFNSYEDFIERCGTQLAKNAVVNLIKCGALDSFGNRINLMNQYINSIVELKDSFSLANIPMLIESGLISKTYEDEIIYYNIYKAICTKPNLVPKDKLPDGLKSDWFYINDNILDVFLDKYNEMKEDLDYVQIDFGTYIVHKGKIKKALDKKIEKITMLLKDKEVVNKYNAIVYKEIYDKYCKGSIAKWEMDSMSYYKTEHELSKVNTKRYTIENFYDLPEDPVANETGFYRGRPFNRYKLSLIMGTVLDRDKTKHTVELLTPSGVVTCKMYDGSFNHYNRTLSKVQEDGKKKRIEESWFKRGTLMMVYGFRLGDQFKPRKYKNSVFQHTIMKITRLMDNGEIIVQEERVSV